MSTFPVDSVWDWKSFSGGEGDGFNYGPPGSYRSGSNIETRTLESGVRITNKPTELSTYEGSVLSVNRYEPNCFSTRSSNTGKIYYNGTFKFNMATATVAHNMIRGWGKMTRLSDNTVYSYGFSETDFGVGKVHRFDTNFGAVTASVATFTLPFSNVSNPPNYKLPVVNYAGGIVFGYSNGVYVLSNTETLTLKLSFDTNVEVVGITYFQNKWKIYTNVQRYANGPVDSRISIWDGDSLFLSEYSQYDNSPIRSVTNDGDKDYVVFGDGYTSDLYIVQGLGRQELRVNVEGSSGNSRVFGIKATIREGVWYGLGANKNLTSLVYSYGKYYNGTPMSLVPENVGNYDDINAKEQVIYLYDNDGGGSGVGKVYEKSILINNASESLGTIVSYAQLGQGRDTIKTIKEIKVGYDLYNFANSIKIYARKDKNMYDDNTTGWTLLRTITEYTKKGVKINRGELIALNLGDFYSLELKVELVQPASYYSPILYRVKTIFTDNIKE